MGAVIRYIGAVSLYLLAISILLLAYAIFTNHIGYTIPSMILATIALIAVKGDVRR